MDSLIIVILVIILIIMILVIYNKFLMRQFYQVSCKWRRYGCCNDGITAKLDIFGSNCRGF